MKYVRMNKRRKGGSSEAIFRQRIETANAPQGLPWQKLPDGTKGNAVDQWAWDKFKESGNKEYPTELERMVAIDNGTIARFIEDRKIEVKIVSVERVLLGMHDREVTIDIPEQTNTTDNGAEWRESQKKLKLLMDEAQAKRDHLSAIQMIIKKDLPATTENYQKMRDRIVYDREIDVIFEQNRKEP